MLAFHDRASIHGAIKSTLDPHLRALIAASIKQDIQGATYDLIDVSSIVIVQPGDTEEDIQRELGFSPLVDVDGRRFGSDAFNPDWNVLHAHTGWFELVFCLGNDGFAFVLFVQDAEGVDANLLDLCRTHARPTR